MDDIRRRLAAGLELGMAYVTALFDERLDCLWVSPSIGDVAGWSPAELVGRNVLEFLHPDDLVDIGRLMDAERAKPTPYGPDPARRSTNRVRFRTRAGGWVAFEFAANNQLANPEVRGLVVILAETTERRLLDDVYDAMATAAPIDEIATKVGELVSWQAERACVWVTVQDLADVVVGTSRDDTVLVTVDVDGLAHISVEHPDDLEPSEWFRLLLDRAAGLLRIAITRHHGELALRRRLDEKTAIISAVSHDLRSPIAAIQLMSNLLDGDGDALTPGQRRELAARISADAHRTSRLLADLTSLDRLLHGSGELHPQRVELRSLVERVLADQRAAEPERVVTLASIDGEREALDAADPIVAHADPVLTERILDNLVANALKHTPREARVEVVLSRDDRHVVVHVDDDGVGVPEEHRTAIFDAYVRGDGSGPRPGSGMGLFLARTFAEVQGGRVVCSESPLGGARFTVVLPHERTRC